MARFGELSGRCNRRLGVSPGRRFVFAVAFTLLAMLSAAATAQADQSVVRAFVYDGAPGATVPQLVELPTLSNCAPYNGPSPVYLYLGGPSAPPASPYPLPSTTWTLATVLTCALQVPLSNVTAVQIAQANAYQGFESPLTPAQLTDPSQFHDPQAAGALPVISVDGTEDQNTYTRPWFGGPDDNAADQVTESNEPVTVAVYENAPPLIVHVSWATISQSTARMKDRFRATVRTASGVTVPGGALKWSWNFSDGAPSTAATPTHSFPTGVAPVTVQVTDSSAGTAGTATVNVSARTSPAPGKSTHSGGDEKTRSTSPVGSDRGRTGGNTASIGKSHTTSTTTTAGATTTAGTTTPANTTAHHTAASHAAASHAVPSPAARPRRPPAKHRAQPATAVRGAVVDGLLISDVKPADPTIANAGSTPASSPEVRQATQATSSAFVFSGLVIVALLGLGAGRELRGNRRSATSGSAR